MGTRPLVYIIEFEISFHYLPTSYETECCHYKSDINRGRGRECRASVGHNVASHYKDRHPDPESQSNVSVESLLFLDIRPLVPELNVYWQKYSWPRQSKRPANTVRICNINTVLC